MQVDPDKAFAVQIKHEESVLTGNVAYMQCAVLFSSSNGERRIRYIYTERTTQRCSAIVKVLTTQPSRAHVGKKNCQEAGECAALFLFLTGNVVLTDRQHNRSSLHSKQQSP